MRALLFKLLFRRVFDDVARGDLSLALSLADERIRFRFPGRHPFAADYDHIDDVAEWLRRFASYQPRLEIHDVAVTGPPWNTRAFVWYRDWIESTPRGSDYTNEICSVVRLRWFKMTEFVVHLDTQNVADHFGTETNMAKQRSPATG